MNTGIGAVVAVAATVAAGVLLLLPKAESPIRTTVCEVMRQPERFNGKIVQIRTNVVSGMETGGLLDRSCSGFILVDNFDTTLSRLKGEFAYLKSLDDLKEPESLTWRPIETPRPVFCNENGPYRALLYYVGKKLRVGKDRRICYQCSLFEVTATMTGRFDPRNSRGSHQEPAPEPDPEPTA